LNSLSEQNCSHHIRVHEEKPYNKCWVGRFLLLNGISHEHLKQNPIKMLLRD